VGLRAGLDTQARGKILNPRRGSNPGRPARSQTLLLSLGLYLFKGCLISHILLGNACKSLDSLHN
jgi:hypothetical protein